MDSTTRLLLNKPNPDPETGDFVDVAKLNENFDKLDAAIGATICTSTTRPAIPFDGQFIRETDTRRLYVWNASQTAWDQVVIGTASFTQDINLTRQIEVIRANSLDHTFRTRVGAEGSYRMRIEAGGGILWGDGTASADTNLYRGAANVLRTDDSLSANAYQINGNQSWVMTYSNEAAASSSPVVTTTVTDVPGCTLTFTTRKAGAIVKASYSFDFASSAGTPGTAVGRVSIGGVEYGGDSLAIFNPANTTAGARSSVANFKRAVLGAAGSYTVKLRAATLAGSGFTVQSSQTKLLVEVFE